MVSIDAGQVITGGGTGLILLAIWHTAKLVIEWRGQSHALSREDTSAPIGDAAAANAVLLNSMSSVHEENARLVSRVRSLEQENEAKDRKIDDLESRIRQITEDLGRVTEELAALRH